MLKRSSKVVTIVALTTGARLTFNMEGGFFCPFVVLLFTQISTNAAQFNFSQFNDFNSINEAAEVFFPSNILSRFSQPQFDSSTRVISSKCGKQVELLKDGLRNNTRTWALQMVDASSKIPSGILRGNIKDLGMYDECIAINTVENGEEIRGHHCMYGVEIKMGETKLIETLSVCLPATCGPDDIQQVLTDTFEMALMLGINFNVSGVTCSSLEPQEWTTGGIVTLVGFAAIILFLTICTICDIFLMYSNEKYGSNNGIVTLCKFSFYTNARRIFNTKSTPQTLPALQGLRFFSMCWVILGHAYFMHLFAPSVNVADLVEWASSWQSIYLMIGTFTVDTFFTISGFLMSYLFLKEMSTGRSFNIFAYYIHRYLRLTPAYAALILMSIFILPRMGSGPVWQSMVMFDDEICRKSWWSMLLYTQNYYNKGCMPHTWYLATEMQYFWLSPIVLYPLARKPKIGLFILAACFVASVATPTIIGYQNEYSNSMFANGDIQGTLRTLEKFYMESHIRAGPFLIGIFFGYLVFTQKGESRRATKWIGWILTIGIFLFCIFSRRKFQQPDYKYEKAWETFYIAVARPSWAAAVAWIIYACVRGFGGPVTTFLSFPIFHPLSRLSYCMYLVHYIIQSMKVRATRVPRFFSDFRAFDNFLSDLMLSLIFAFVLSLVFESPVLVLERLVKERNRRKINESNEKLKDVKVENGIDNFGLNLTQ